MERTATGPLPDAADGGAGTIVPKLTIAVAVMLQIALLVPFTVASGLIAPLWATLGLYALWLVSAAALAYVARHRPLAAPLVPAVYAVLLWLAIAAGEGWLGWTA